MGYRGPTAPWADDDEDEILPLVVQRCKEFIVNYYVGRIETVKSLDTTGEDLKLELQKLLAACAVNDPVFAYYVVSMLEDLLHAEENARTLT